jgi:hypothetical protein
MFAAIRSEEVIAVGVDIGFTDSISNVGQGFDVSRGVFTAPVTGTFEFSFSALSGKSEKAFVRVIKNGTVMLTFGENNVYTGSYNNFGYVWQLILQKGDEITLHLNTGSIYASTTHPISFIGHLVAE